MQGESERHKKTFFSVTNNFVANAKKIFFKLYICLVILTYSLVFASPGSPFGAGLASYCGAASSTAEINISNIISNITINSNIVMIIILLVLSCGLRQRFLAYKVFI